MRVIDLLNSTMSGIITKDECMFLNDTLGTRTPSACFALSRSDHDDPFTVPDSTNKFEGRDAVKHRNSWLMPRLARRLTRDNKYHVSNWRQYPTVDVDECNKIREALSKKIGPIEAEAHLPKACNSL